MNLTLLVYLLHQGWHSKQPWTKTEVKLGLLTDIDKLLMVEKGIRGGICHAIHWIHERLC